MLLEFWVTDTSLESFKIKNQLIVNLFPWITINSRSYLIKKAVLLAEMVFYLSKNHPTFLNQ